MSKQRFRFGPPELIFALAALFFLGGLFALGFPQFYSTENRARIILTSSLVLIFCFALLVSIQLYRKQRRAREWRQIMAAWVAEKEAGEIPIHDLAAHLSQGALVRLAAQVYTRMGYRVYDPQDNEHLSCKIQLLNPEGQLELLFCIQEDHPLGLREVSQFHAALIREKAERGFIWAPSGFSRAALYWTSTKPIVLADSTEICRLIESKLTQHWGKAGRFR